MSDIELGRKVLKAFYDYSALYYPSAFNFSFDSFLRSYQPIEAKLNIILDGIGGGVREANISSSKISDAMSAMARVGGGRIPKDYNSFFSYLSNEAVKINWIDALSYTATESAKDIIGGAGEVGESILSAGKFINFILPVLLIGGVLIFFLSWLNTSTKGDALRIFKALRK